MAIGFDDFRESDFTLIKPLFDQYGAHTTFNRIHRSTTLSEGEINQIRSVLESGHELGDHTWFHYNYVFNNPLCNGQDEYNPDGDQIAYPSNAQLREDRGDGYNVFEYPLDGLISDTSTWRQYDCTWRQLSDAQCQEMRNAFSI